jgi:hypothetical protein
MLGWLVYEHGIEPHVTVFDKSARQDGTFSRDDFTYDHDGDVYYCPGGKILTTTGSRINDGATLRYRASKYDCEACRLKPRCCPKEPARYVPRSIYEGARDMARQIARSWEGRIAGVLARLSSRRSKSISKSPKLRVIRGPWIYQEYLRGMWRLNHSFLKVLFGRGVHTVASVLARARPA